MDATRKVESMQTPSLPPQWPYTSMKWKSCRLGTRETISPLHMRRISSRGSSWWMEGFLAALLTTSSVELRRFLGVVCMLAWHVDL